MGLEGRFDLLAKGPMGMIQSSEDSRSGLDLGPRFSNEPSPTFCSKCRADGFSGEAMCRSCGDLVAPRGYCSTCEAFWKLAVGEDCPKHDVPLEDAPPPLEPLGIPGNQAERWVTVATYNHPNEANAPRIRLEAEGIATFLDGERVAVATLYQVATGGVRLQVPDSLASAARVLLAQVWTARLDPRDEPEDDEDDPWAGLAPDPGARRRTIMKGAILIFLFGPALLTALNFVAQMFGLRL